MTLSNRNTALIIAAIIVAAALIGAPLYVSVHLSEEGSRPATAGDSDAGNDSIALLNAVLVWDFSSQVTSGHERNLADAVYQKVQQSITDPTEKLSLAGDTITAKEFTLKVTVGGLEQKVFHLNPKECGLFLQTAAFTGMYATINGQPVVDEQHRQANSQFCSQSHENAILFLGTPPAIEKKQDKPRAKAQG